MNRKFAGIIKFFGRLHLPSKLILLIVGGLSTLWFLFRVIPKPQRAAYPCMRAAAPWASAFVIYLAGITISVFSLKKFRLFVKTSRYPLAIIFLATAVTAGFMGLTSNPARIYSAEIINESTALEAPNSPMGAAQGIYPGRVVWVYDTNSTNINCTNTFGDAYFMDKNTNQGIVDNMLQDAVMKITGKNTTLSAWDALFKYYNQQHGKGTVGYASDEIIFIKINCTSTWGGNYNTSDLSRVNNSYYAINETSPQLILSVLRQLVNEVGVPQANIYIGDPLKHIYKDNYEKWHAEFPNVHYMDNSYSTLGREKFTPSGTETIQYSDHGSILPYSSDYLYSIFEQMDYMINIPTMKAHARAGVTMFAKNHFGSQTRSDASHLHNGLVRVSGSPADDRNTYGQYRVQVDLLGHKYLGKKNLVYLMDALYSSQMEIIKPDKWEKAPWNKNWTSSILISQDPVAIESVGFDMLYNEYDGNNSYYNYPHFGAVDDYLHQAADTNNWPTGIRYDPENDGTVLTSLGTHEHWNNATNMEYSRNLGTGNGIELVKIKRNDPISDGIYTTANSDLPSDMVNVIYVDSANVKWIGTDLGLARFNDTVWTIYSTADHLFNNKVNDIAYERTNYGRELWIATDSGLTAAAIDIDGITSATTYHKDNSGLACNIIRRVAVDIIHNRWVGTRDNISVFRVSTWTNLDIWDDVNKESFNIIDYPVTDIKPYDNDTQAYISTAGKGVMRIRYDEIDGFTGASTYGQPWSAINSNNVNCIDIKNSIQWFGSDKGIVSHSSNKPKDDFSIYTADSGLTNNLVTAIHIDNSDNIWCGTEQGLSVYNGKTWYTYNQTMGLVNNSIRYITSDIEGGVWVATAGGIQKFNAVPGIAVLKTPVLLTPANAVMNTSTNLDFTWQAVEGATGYTIQIDTSDLFNNPIYSATVTSTSYSIQALKPNTKYYWRVAATRPSDTGPWSTTRRFTTGTQNGIVNVQAGLTQLQVYPNPATDELFVKLNIDKQEKVKIFVYDLKGSIIDVPFTGYIDPGKTIRIALSDISKYSSGFYILSVQGDNFQKVTRFVKN